MRRTLKRKKRRALKQETAEMRISYVKELNASFEEALRSPQRWLWCAIKLKEAADRIDEIPLVVGIYCLLLGLSFEILIKGTLIATGASAGTIGNLSRDFQNHYLHELVSKIDPKTFSVSVDEKELLEKLSQYVVWAGRYPIALRASDLVNWVVPPGTPVLIRGRVYGNPKSRKGSGFINTDRKLARQLWDRLSVHLATLAKPQNKKSKAGGRGSRI